MGSEVLPRHEITKSDRGSYFITEDRIVLIELSAYELFKIEMNKLVKENPDYIFEVENNPIRGGWRVSWKKKEPKEITDDDSTDAGGAE